MSDAGLTGADAVSASGARLVLGDGDEFAQDVRPAQGLLVAVDGVRGQGVGDQRPGESGQDRDRFSLPRPA